MKRLITEYEFSALRKTVIFPSEGNMRIDGILLITNVTRNIIIYNFANSLMGGTLSGIVLTLTYDTSSMADTDKLQIWYEDGVVNLNQFDTVLDVLEQILTEIKQVRMGLIAENIIQEVG